MFRAAIIENNEVVNVIMLNDLSEYPGAIASEECNIGDAYIDGVFIPPAPPPEVVSSDSAV